MVVAVSGRPDCYRVIDGYKRVAALEQLGRDTVQAVIWPMSDAEALVLDRTMRFSEPESALEQGWLLSELEQRFGYSLDDLGRQFDHSPSWVSRRLALVELLPDTVQQQVRTGPDWGPCGDEVSGSRGARQPGPLPTDGQGLCQPPV